jgi:hypothetical protein
MKPDRESVLDELLEVVLPQGNPRKAVSLAGATHRSRDDARFRICFAFRASAFGFPAHTLSTSAVTVTDLRRRGKHAARGARTRARAAHYSSS